MPQVFDGAQMAQVCYYKDNSDQLVPACLSLIAIHNANTSTKETQIIWIETEVVVF